MLIIWDKCSQEPVVYLIDLSSWNVSNVTRYGVMFLL